MQATATRPKTARGVPPEHVRAAFRDLHGSRLHGFALLVTLGDRARAARLAGDALTAGALSAAELRHPERAAAWLRRRVAHDAGRRRGRVGRPRAGDGPMALDPLGVDAAAFAGLSALSPRERAALVADSVERLDRGDVATVAGVEGMRLDRLLRRARERYVAAVSARIADGSAGNGPMATRIRAVATRALS